MEILDLKKKTMWRKNFEVHREWTKDLSLFSIWIEGLNILIGRTLSLGHVDITNSWDDVEDDVRKEDDKGHESRH